MVFGVLFAIFLFDRVVLDRPYLGLSLQDLCFLREGNLPVVGAGWINMRLWGMVGNVVWPLVQAQRELCQMRPVVSSVQEEIMEIWLGIPIEVAGDHAYHKSLLLKPRGT